MAVTLEDLDWCQDQIMPASPGLPHRPAYQKRSDAGLPHNVVSGSRGCGEKFGFKVNDAMWDFTSGLGLSTTPITTLSNYGDPVWVYYQFRLGQGRHAAEGGSVRGRPAYDERGRTKRVSISRRVTAKRSGI